MRIGVRILHLLRAGEQSPPLNVARAAGQIHLLRAGIEPDTATREFGAHVATICGGVDFDGRNALEKIESLEIPAVGIGTGANEYLTTYVSRDISADDLRMVFDLVHSIATMRRLAATECRARETGQCTGPVMDDLILLLEQLLCLRIPDYSERAGQVFDTALWICNHLSLPPEELKDILRAARLREIGKLGLSDRLLFTHRQQRTREEQAEYDRYPEMGAHALNQLAALRSVAAVVRNQLENFDGSGPGGLMAHQIPLGSRILRVAGAFSMLKVKSEDDDVQTRDVMDILERGRGSLYDPLLVKLIENLHSLGNEDILHQATRWVKMTELQEGMILAEDVWSRTGMKIIPRGTRLTPHIMKILHQFPVDPVIDSVRVVN